MARLEVRPFSASSSRRPGSSGGAAPCSPRQPSPCLPPSTRILARLGEVEALAAGDGARDGRARGDRVVGFLIGAPRDDAIWGPNVWVESAGHAVEEARISVTLYAAALPAGSTRAARHYALVPGSTPAGRTHGYAPRSGSSTRRHPRGARVAGRTGVRSGAEPRDVDALVALTPLLATTRWRRRSVAGSPPRTGRRCTRAARRVPRRGGHGRRPRASAARRSSALRGAARRAIEQGVAHLPVAATQPRRPRPRHRLRARTTAPSLGARADGHATIVTDWRVTNLLASRFWLARGFVPTHFRLRRYVRHSPT